MHNSKIRLAILVGCMALSANLWAKAQPVQATLAGHAILPAKIRCFNTEGCAGRFATERQIHQRQTRHRAGQRGGQIRRTPDRTQPADQWSAVAGPLRYQTHARRYLLGAD